MGVIVPNPTVTEEDGSPTITNVKTIKVSNGTLTKSGRTATIETGGSGGGGTVTAVTGASPISSTGGTTPEISLNDDGVVRAKIGPAAVGTDELGVNSVTTAKITDASVTVAKISATGTPGSTNYLRGDGSWSTVSSGGSGTVTGVTGTAPIVSDGSSTTPAISLADNGITSDKIANDAVTQSKIAAFSVVNNRLATDSVSTDKIQDDAVTVDKIGTTSGTPSSDTYFRGDGTWSTPSGGGSGVTSVTGTSPVVSSGGTTPAISIADNGIGISKLVNSGGTPSSTTFLRGDGQWQVPAGDGTDQTLFPQSDATFIWGGAEGSRWRGSSNVWISPNMHGTSMPYYGSTNGGYTITSNQINFNSWYTPHSFTDIKDDKISISLQRGGDCTTTTVAMFAIYTNSADGLPSTMVACTPITPGVAGAGTTLYEISSATWYTYDGTAITADIPLSAKTQYWFGITGAYEPSDGSAVSAGINFRSISTGTAFASDSCNPSNYLARKGSFQQYYAGGPIRGQYTFDSASSNTSFRGLPNAWPTSGSGNPQLVYDYVGNAPIFIIGVAVA